jgi:radical SAM superfamily enzyme YgiQ (UPF0313 family)
MRSRQRTERARGILARETGYILKPHGGRLRVALAFPNTYYVGMSNLGFQAAYRLFNAADEAVCERVFLPSPEELRAGPTTRGALSSLESGTPVCDFDVLAFSVSFEWDYPNILTILRLAGIPLRSADRNDHHPLVVVGGAVTFLNPEPLAPFADVIAVGEGEILVPRIIEGAGQGGGRSAAMNRLAREPGMYVPSLVGVDRAEDGRIRAFEPAEAAAWPIRKAALKADAVVEPPATAVFTPDTEFGSRLLVEVVRGCSNLCRFCWAGYNYLPVRAFDADRILAIAESARPHADRIGLVSIALCDHPEIERILSRLRELGYAISPASLRLDDMTPGMLRLLVESGERSITIAPEAGSDRLRRVVNKTVTNEEILETAELAFANGVENLKLYYLLGVPTEDDEDLVAIRDLTLAIRGRMLKHARSRGAIGRITASVNPLVPKPGTALQWMPMAAPAALARKAKRLRELVAGIDNAVFTIKSERHSFYQALLSLGDRRVAAAIEAAERNGGNWRAAVRETGLDPEWYVLRDRSADPVLPWDVITGGIRPSFLRSEADRALRAEWTVSPRRQPALRVRRTPAG